MKYYCLVLLFTTVAAYKVIVSSDNKPADDASTTQIKKEKSGAEAKENGPPLPQVPDFNIPSSLKHADNERDEGTDTVYPRSGDGTQTNTSWEGVPSIFDLFRRQMREMHRRFMSNFFVPVLQQSPEGSQTSSDKPTSTEIPFVFKLFDNIFGSLGSGGSSANSDGKNLFDIPSVGELPPTYKNSTSEIRQVGDAKVQVNQTIHKTNENGRKNLFIFKVINVLPENMTQEGQPIFQNEPKNEDGKSETFKNVDDRLNEIREDDFETNDNYDVLNRRQRKARSIEIEIPNKAIAFPPNQLDRFPYSFINNKNVRSEDIKRLLTDSRSKSFVYKNMGGKTTFYIVNHKAKPVDSSAAVDSKDPDTEIVGPIRKPDLSRDTLVNPSGGDGEQQGLIQVDPDAEVFDLNLLIKEIESRPKKD